ncbi:hypothetical protein POM88_035813 [Heracleum sosnowskyi]|uniref:Uncharacterized protein n=1 Tax=Heracleum sosnowskyi TaxID=360622 RepID=A0AAD8MDM0_9APIA|nr:hypothetical protein POM88_035813 [Heracleum sosnowskyi]
MNWRLKRILIRLFATNVELYACAPEVLAKINISSGFKLSSQIIMFEHEGNWSKALEYYDLQEDEMSIRKPYKGLIRSLQQLGCTHVLDLYSQGLTSRKGRFQHDFEFIVYWLAIDYLVVAKSAISCGSYFTAVLYVGHLCEEKFKCLTLGSPDFSDLELLPHHIEILVTAVTQINEPRILYGIVQLSKVVFGCWLFSTNILCEDEMRIRKPYKGLIRSLQQLCCTHVLDLYSQGLTSRKGRFQHDFKFTELQYEKLLGVLETGIFPYFMMVHYVVIQVHKLEVIILMKIYMVIYRNCKRGDAKDFYLKLKDAKQELLFSIYHASEESTEYIYTAVVKCRRVLLQVLSCTVTVHHPLESASTLCKGARLSQAAAALHEFKSLSSGKGITQNNLYLIGRNIWLFVSVILICLTGSCKLGCAVHVDVP